MNVNDYTTENCYSVLDIAWSSSPQEIRRAYIKKAKENHPDVGGTHNQQVKINAAYEILSNPLEREKHDRYWRNLNVKFDPSIKANENFKSWSSPPSDRLKRKPSIDKLFSRLSNLSDQMIAKLSQEREKWIDDRIVQYRKSIEAWKVEQERICRLDFSLYKSTIRKKLHKRRLYFRFATISSEVAVIFTIFSFASIIFGVDIVINFSFLITFVLWFVGLFLWLLYIDQKHIYVMGEKITVDDTNSEETIRRLLIKNLRRQKLQIGSVEILYDSTDWQSKINNLVQGEWQDKHNREEATIQATYQKYLKYLTEISNVLERDISFDSSEEQAARRIAATFFIMGYLPISYDSQLRMFVFNDGSENIVIRFRHRIGIPTNISYVRRVFDFMRVHRAYRGFLFCTPGLSDNAAKFAHDHSVTWYSLESMNEWIENVVMSGYEGPPGDFYYNLQTMVFFLAQISISLPTRM